MLNVFNSPSIVTLPLSCSEYNFAGVISHPPILAISFVINTEALSAFVTSPLPLNTAKPYGVFGIGSFPSTSFGLSTSIDPV